MTHEPTLPEGPAFKHGQFKIVEYVCGMRSAGAPPADAAPREGIDHDGHGDEAGPTRGIHAAYTRQTDLILSSSKDPAPRSGRARCHLLEALGRAN